MAYIIIDDTIYEINTPEDIADAQAAMREVDLTACPVYVGDPDGPDSYATGRILFA